MKQFVFFIFFNAFFLLFPAYSTSNQLIPNGSQHYYNLINKVTINDLQRIHESLETSYTHQTKLLINSVWNSENEQLLEIFFLQSKVNGPKNHANKKAIEQKITKIPDRPFYISLIDGKPNKVIAHTSRDQSLLNIERGIASLLQLQYANGPITELDVSGRCNTFYDINSSTRITKTKTDCVHWDLRVNYRTEKSLSVDQHSDETINYILSADGQLLSANSIEHHRVTLEAKPDIGNEIKSELSLTHTAIGDDLAKQLDYPTLDEAIKSLLEWYRVFDIEADVDGVLSELKDSSLKAQIKLYAKSLTTQNIGKQTLALAIAKLLPYARITQEAEFVEILTTNTELQDQLVDLLAAVQTLEAHNAIIKVYDFNNKAHYDLLEKYLQSLALGTHPEPSIIAQLFQRLQQTENTIKNLKLRDTLIQTIASLTRHFSDKRITIFDEIRTYLVKELTENCEKFECKALYIRALQNLQDATTISTLIEYAINGDEGLSVVSMQALKSFPITNFNEKDRKSFTQIFYQKLRKYDTSARALALDIILSMKPTPEQLADLLDYLASNDKQYEIKTYVIQKLRMLAEKCPRFNALLSRSLAEKPKINNYNIIAQKGLTTVLSRKLSQAPAFNESLLSIQEINKGVLKRGTVELLLGAGRDETSIFKLGIFTNGLSSFVSDNNSADDDDDDEDEADNAPATAGMEISVQGVLLRPLVFFTGQTELMGHVWSGTASDSTPAYQATTLAQDHEHYIILSSGATVYLRIIGTKSIDLNGKVDFSIWNRNAETEIKQNTGTAIVGYVTAGFTYAKVENEFILTSEPNLSLQANIDFYSDIKLCMQLQRPQLNISLINNRNVQLNAGKKYQKNVRTKLSYKSPGHTLALNQKNNEMCNMIFS